MAGSNMSNFLATDKVPDTIFGIPVVSRKEDYTEADLEFFGEHPEAGGYYDMGGDETEPGAQGASGGGDSDAKAEYLSEDAVTDRFNQAVDAALPFILEHEGFRADAYKNKGDKWTVGHGLTRIPDGATGRMRAVREGDSITEAESKKLALRILRDAAVYAYKNYEWSRHASPYALASALDVMYNTGSSVFGEERSPTMYANMKNIMSGGSFGPGLVDAEIRRQLPTYRTFNGKVLAGLVNRRKDADEVFFARPDRERQASANVHVNAVPRVVYAQKGAR